MAKHIQTQTEWESTMARRIMDQLRGELYLDQRYLNAALGALPPVPLPPGTTGAAFAADGARLCYPPAWVLATYRKNRRYLPRAYLHSVLHCIFRHLWLRGGRDRTLWGLACDIAVENTLDSLNTPATTRPVGWLRQQAYQQLQNQCGLLARRAYLPRTAGVRRGNADQVAAGVHLRRPPLLACRPGQPAGPDAGQTVGAAGPPDAAEHGGIRPGTPAKTPVPAPCKRKYRPAEAAAATGIFCAGSLSGMRNPISTPKNSTWAFTATACGCTAICR